MISLNVLLGPKIRLSALILIVVLLMTIPPILRCQRDAERHLAAAEKAEGLGDTAAFLRELRIAASFSAPFVAASEIALQRLISYTEQRGLSESARADGLEELVRALSVTRSWRSVINGNDTRLAVARAELRKVRPRRVIDQDPTIRPVWVFLTQIFFVGWLFTVYRLIRYGFDRNGSPRHPGFFRRVCEVLGTFALYLVALGNA